jgi:hypothetical protein
MTGKAVQAKDEPMGVQLERVPSVIGVDPNYLLGQASRMATALGKVVNTKRLYATISGRKYIVCEGWTTLAAMNGVTPHEVSVTETDGIFVATVELRRMSDGVVSARASAECGAPDELDKHGKPVWSTRPRYARRSMALTRATAKACRLAFSWIVALAGMDFSTTPAEEVPAGGFEDREALTEPAPASGAPGPTAAPSGKNPSDAVWRGRKLSEYATEELMAEQRSLVAAKKPAKFGRVIDAIAEELMRRGAA